MKIKTEDALFFGSSGGGYTSIQLATLLRTKATVINPQLDIREFWPHKVAMLEKVVLGDNETLLPERCSVIELSKRENYFPKLKIIQNTKAERDLKTQIYPFLLGLLDADIDCTDKLDIEFYYHELGHKGIISQEKSINYIKQGLNI